MHKALIRADAAALDPELYSPLVAAMERLTGWLRSMAESGALQKKGHEQWELVLAGPKVRHGSRPPLPAHTAAGLEYRGS